MPTALPKNRLEDYVLFPEARQVRPLGFDTDGSVQSLPTRDEEGSLAIDVAETDDELLIRSAIAGVRPEALELFVQHDMLTLRGWRTDDIDPSARKLVNECHWGSFSRSLILPMEIDKENVVATFKDGVLTVRLPKTRRPNRKIEVKGL